MRVLVCGGRTFGEMPRWARMGTVEWHTCHETVRRERECLQGVLSRVDATTIIHGGAKGADRHADKFARATGLAVEVFKADWETNGKAAGPIRNQRMLDEGKPDLVVAFPGGKGTADMVRRARAAGVKVLEIDT